MIHEVDQALRSLLTTGMPAGSDVGVSFDAPTRDWAARRNGPAVNAYLYDIREDLERRQHGYVPVIDTTSGVARRRPQPRWFRLSYLVSAWTGQPEEEHRLLSSLLIRLVTNEVLTPAVLPGALGAMALDVMVTVSPSPVASRSLAEIWSALGGELRPSLDLMVTAPLPVDLDIEAGPLVTEAPSINLRRRQ
ncbi:DUF4255 domain-containing protein [Streptomyces sp. NPDC001288]|uniref:DUF4255 domain-containing protein n=1 Tax=Streptomyces sp. NPDC001297 TaxID=3364559 RepID=UPI003699CCFF